MWERLYSISEVAFLLGCHVDTLRYHIGRGHVAPDKVKINQYCWRYGFTPLQVEELAEILTRGRKTESVESKRQ